MMDLMEKTLAHLQNGEYKEAIPAADCLNDGGKSRVTLSTVMRLANSPAIAPPIRR